MFIPKIEIKILFLLVPRHSITREYNPKGLWEEIEERMLT